LLDGNRRNNGGVGIGNGEVGLPLVPGRLTPSSDPVRSSAALLGRKCVTIGCSLRCAARAEEDDAAEVEEWCDVAEPGRNGIDDALLLDVVRARKEGRRPAPWAKGRGGDGRDSGPSRGVEPRLLGSCGVPARSDSERTVRSASSSSSSRSLSDSLAVSPSLS
jgi:hypothetical protein